MNMDIPERRSWVCRTNTAKVVMIETECLAAALTKGQSVF
jgi:hypothetical protein